MQRAAASSSGLITSEPQIGQSSGNFILRGRPFRFSVSTLTTSGITSPARRTITVSPTRTSFRCSSSKLCSVALLTVTPPTNTGFNLATGVTVPVRPTCHSIATTVVNCSWAGNLCAIAQRGARETKPSCACNSKSSTL